MTGPKVLTGTETKTKAWIKNMTGPESEPRLGPKMSQDQDWDQGPGQATVLDRGRDQIQDRDHV